MNTNLYSDLPNNRAANLIYQKFHLLTIFSFTIIQQVQQVHKQIKTLSLLSVVLTIPIHKLPCLLPFSPLGTKVEKEIVVLHSFFNYTHIHCHLVKCMNIFRVDQNLKFPVKAIFSSSKMKYKSGSGKFALNLSIFWIDQIKSIKIVQKFRIRSFGLGC